MYSSNYSSNYELRTSIHIRISNRNHGQSIPISNALKEKHNVYSKVIRVQAGKNKKTHESNMTMPKSFADVKETTGKIRRSSKFYGGGEPAIMVSSHPSSVHDAFPSARLQSTTQTPDPKKAQANESKKSKDREKMQDGCGTEKTITGESLELRQKRKEK
jgi:hypothetical protein